jgi:hypothetical protein
MTSGRVCRHRTELLFRGWFVAFSFILLEAELRATFATRTVVATAHFAALISLPVLRGVIHLFGGATIKYKRAQRNPKRSHC